MLFKIMNDDGDDSVSSSNCGMLACSFIDKHFRWIKKLGKLEESLGLNY